MAARGLATEHGGVHVDRVLTVLQHVSSGLVHLHRLSLTFGDLDPSQVMTHRCYFSSSLCFF